MDLVLFLLSFGIILVSCELFTNGVEWVGRRFDLAEGTVGSVLAAVGTALPETVVPLIAILLLPSAGSAGQEIGIGAIMGSPFMIGTLALFVCGLSLLLYRRRRGTGTLQVSGGLIRRDLGFFLLAYSLAALVAFLPPDMGWPRLLLGVSLVPLYGVYIWRTLRSGTSLEGELEPLYGDSIIARITRRKARPGEACRERRAEPPTSLIFIQVVVALLGIILGANLFVEQIREIATDLGVSPLLLALLIAPLATELPEMYNSFTWVRGGKDIYAIGNLTGAMVFQSCIPVTVGLLLTPWHIAIGDPQQALQAASMGIALLSAAVLYARSSRKELGLPSLFFGGLLYAVFLVLVLLSLGGV